MTSATQVDSWPTRKLITGALVAGAANELWGNGLEAMAGTSWAPVAQTFSGPMVGELVGALIAAGVAVAVAWFVPDRPNVPTDIDPY